VGGQDEDSSPFVPDAGRKPGAEDDSPAAPGPAGT